MFKKTSYPTKSNQLIETFDGLFTAAECQQLHEGAPVTSGIKYVLRTDVMYKHALAQ